MMMVATTRLGALLLAAWTFMVGSSAAAEDLRWSARMGYALASFDTQSQVRVAGARLPGAEVAIEDEKVLLGDVGLAFDPHWSARLALGAPAVLRVAPSGSLRQLQPPLGKTLGSVEMAPLILTMVYMPRAFGRFDPYAGVGATYGWVRHATPGDLGPVNASSEWGLVVQTGCETLIGSKWTAFVDVRKLFVATNVTGNVAALGGAPAEASVTLDPLILNAGIGYRF